MLSKNSAKSRFDFSARNDLCATYLPFAMAGVAATAWAATHPPIDTPEPGRYLPGWLRRTLTALAYSCRYWSPTSGCAVPHRRHGPGCSSE